MSFKLLQFGVQCLPLQSTLTYYGCFKYILLFYINKLITRWVVVAIGLFSLFLFCFRNNINYSIFEVDNKFCRNIRDSKYIIFKNLSKYAAADTLQIHYTVYALQSLSICLHHMNLIFLIKAI